MAFKLDVARNQMRLFYKDMNMLWKWYKNVQFGCNLIKIVLFDSVKSVLCNTFTMRYRE